MANYIIDVDALKDCLGLLPKPVKNGNLEYVCLQAVKEMIDKFPKEEYGVTYRQQLDACRNASVEINKVNQDILSGKGLSKI